LRIATTSRNDAERRDAAATGPTGVRAQLGATVASAAVPYGYTITLGGSIAIAVGELGRPHLFGALMLMLGAVAGFVALEAIAQGNLRPQATRSDRPLSIWGNAHVLSAGLALVAVSGVDDVASGGLGWALTGFLATTIYFVVTTCQRMIAARWSER
jgi:hypothetical protein